LIDLGFFGEDAKDNKVELLEGRMIVAERRTHLTRRRAIWRRGLCARHSERTGGCEWDCRWRWILTRSRSRISRLGVLTT